MWHATLVTVCSSECDTKLAMCTAGKALTRKALPSPELRQGQLITNHPYSSPLHKVKSESLMPTRLLTPLQAEVCA